MVRAGLGTGRECDADQVGFRVPGPGTSSNRRRSGRRRPLPEGAGQDRDGVAGGGPYTRAPRPPGPGTGLGHLKVLDEVGIAALPRPQAFSRSRAFVPRRTGASASSHSRTTRSASGGRGKARAGTAVAATVRTGSNHFMGEVPRTPAPSYLEPCIVTVRGLTTPRPPHARAFLCYSSPAAPALPNLSEGDPPARTDQGREMPALVKPVLRHAGGDTILTP